MSLTRQPMTHSQMLELLAEHSAHAEPIVPVGWKVPNGYILRGPRGHKACMAVDDDGNVDGDAIRLWLDGIAYSDVQPAIIQTKVTMPG